MDAFKDRRVLTETAIALVAAPLRTLDDAACDFPTCGPFAAEMIRWA